MARVNLATAIGGLAIYGDGSDGDHVCVDGEEILGGFYHDFTIPEGVTVHVATPSQFGTGAPVIFCTGTYTINGTFDLRGQDAVGSTPGGEERNAGNAGSTESGQVAEANRTGPDPGAGGAGDAGPGGAVGPVPAPWKAQWRNPLAALIPNVAYAYSAGGASGAGDGVNLGGAGGGGGTSVVICARHVAHGANNIYDLRGGRGGDAGDDGAGDLGNGNCGGGGGGAAGWWMTISDDLQGEAGVIAEGGAGGSGCGTGEDGATATDEGFVVRISNAEAV